MKKLILIICLAFAFESNHLMHKLHFGVKGGSQLQFGSIIAVTENVFEGAESKTGYHAGIWLRQRFLYWTLY